jgi:hypothetical protein
MEHRMASRRTLMPSTEQCLVEIYLADKQIAMCPVSNIGMAGLGIESCPESLRSGMFLKIIVAAPDSARLLYPDMNALVIWTEDQQAGLMWADRGNSTNGGQSFWAA